MAGGIVSIKRKPRERPPEGDDFIAMTPTGTRRFNSIGIANETKFAADMQPPVSRG
jgi:hypothetical protein